MTAKIPNIAVILPAYNEEATIAETILEFQKALPDAQIVIVDNACSDHTVNIALKTIRELACNGYVLHETRPGKGFAVRWALLNIDADYYVLSDADMTYPANEVMKLLTPVINNEADMVVGDRITSGNYSEENQRKFHEFGNSIVRTLVNKLFSSKLNDIMSGYRAMSKEFVMNYPITVEGFELETDMTLHALDKRYRIKEVTIKYKDRPFGSVSKLNTLSDGARVIFVIAKIFRNYRPMMFFGCLGFIFFLAGLLAGYPVLMDWIREKYIHHTPLAILATGLELTALLLFGVALILDTVAHHDKANHEKALLTNRKGQ